MGRVTLGQSSAGHDLGLGVVEEGVPVCVMWHGLHSVVGCGNLSIIKVHTLLADVYLEKETGREGEREGTTENHFLSPGAVIGFD